MISRKALRAVFAAAVIAPLMTGCFPRRLPVTEMPDTAQIPVTGTRQMVVLPAAAPSPKHDDTATLLGSAVLQLGDPHHIHASIQPHGIPIEAGRIEQVRRTLAALGVASPVILPATEMGDGNFDVALDRWTAGKPNCDSLMRTSDLTHNDERPSVAFGCATISNLSSMIDDPGDLVQPHPLAPGDAVSDVQAVHRYEDNKVTPLKSTTSTNVVPSSGSGN